MSGSFEFIIAIIIVISVCHGEKKPKNEITNENMIRKKFIEILNFDENVGKKNKTIIQE